jgi:hypothetical protein
MKRLGLALAVLLLLTAASATFYIGFNPATNQFGLQGALVDVSPTQAITGCSISAIVGGSTAGQFTSGTTGTCTVTLTDPSPAPNGFTCLLTDMSPSPATVFHQTASSTTGCTASGSTTSGDKIVFIMIGF